MSNAMRFGKRSLAGLAAGALAAGLIPFVAASSAQASVSATVSPVRVSYTGPVAPANLDEVVYAQISWTNSVALAASDSITVSLTTAPSSTARVAFSNIAGIGTRAINDDGTFTGTLGSTTGYGLATATSPAAIGVPTFPATTAGRIGVAANEVGTYAGTLQVRNPSTNATVGDPITFSFTTRGKPTTMTFTPGSQTVPVVPAAALSTRGTNAPLTVAMTDANGLATQPTYVDFVTLSSSPDDSTAIRTGGASSTPARTGTLDAKALFAGTTASMIDSSSAAVAAPQVAFGGEIAGAYVVTALPQGTLTASGLTAQTAIVNVAGSISTSPITAAAITAPVVNIAPTASATISGVYSGSGTPGATDEWQVPSGTASMTVRVTASGATAGDVLRFKVTGPAGGSPSTTASFTNVTLNASKQGTITVPMSGAAIAPTAVVTIEQVNSLNADLSDRKRVVVEQTIPSVPASGATVVPTPVGSIVQKVGTPTSVTVSVANNFDVGVGDWNVTVFRGSVSAANIVATGKTNAAGETTVQITPAATTVAGQTETYLFQAQSATSGAVAGPDSSNNLVILYNATGEVTNLSVNISAPGATNPITSTTTSIAAMPAAMVPTSGVASGTANTIFTVATDAVTGSNAGNFAVFTPVTTPANAVTVTSPEGVFVSGSSSAKAWNAGSRSVTVSSADPVYVWGTKTGVHDITFTSGGKTLVAKVALYNVDTDYYNVAITPAEQTLEANSFGRVTVRVTDVFGNPVDTRTLSYFPVRLTAVGDILLGGNLLSTDVDGGADGTATVAVITGRAAGVAEIRVTPTPGALAAGLAWTPGFTPPTAAPAPIASALAKVTITAAVDKAIVIAGERTTVSGKPGIRVDGEADGFANGAKVKPWVRFPGQSEYTAGSARPVVSDEEFTWQRKTGKKTYVYFTSEDDAIKSNRVIIPAN